ncbi:ABC transporter permease [Alkalibacterium olivapovliticus]|uniref:Transport permease protein n=1 Tax=Alkalibacterium olivapovliticus TaxID=99907 RepID=A0A2T0W9X4_9LACT|nr:ABC transporter permease [Alkalibacterium olivapovliticus]PRY83502.1 ABC-2 type transport system permease protein [Alkalibacterium olivapovliticus]
MDTRQKNLDDAIISTKRPTPPGAMASVGTFAMRSLLKTKHTPMALMDITAMPILFLLMFTYLFGGAIAGSVQEYLQYILPGILVQTVVQITMYTGLDLNKDLQKGFFDRQRTLPIWSPSSLVGAMLFDTLRYSVASVIMIGFAMILGFRPEGNLIGVGMAVALLLLFAFSLSWIWTVLALVMESENALMATAMMIIFPLTFLSSAFVDPETMPLVLEWFVNVNPISMLVDSVRGLMHGYDVQTEILWTLVSSGLLVTLFGPLTMYLYKNKN